MSETERAALLLAEYDAACADQGLPIGTSVARFIRHHRSNAGTAAAFQLIAECGKGCRIIDASA